MQADENEESGAVEDGEATTRAPTHSALARETVEKAVVGGSALATGGFGAAAVVRAATEALPVVGVAGAALTSLAPLIYAVYERRKDRHSQRRARAHAAADTAWTYVIQAHRRTA
jgi:hypothetical protein